MPDQYRAREAQEELIREQAARAEADREIVEMHGGNIRAEFPEDGGSRFVVRLPLQPVD